MNKIALGTVLVAALAACSSEDAGPAPAASVGVAKSTLARDTAPSLTDSERAALSSGQADFAVDLYHAVSSEPARANESIFLSPHSASIALAMAYAGARETTASEMRAALRFALPDERVHAGFNFLDLQLSKPARPFRLSIVNTLFGQKDAPFGAAFLDTLAVNYGAGVNTVDFESDPEKARAAINGWAEEKTEHRVKDLLSEGKVDRNTRLVAVNAVYFNAKWGAPFDKEATHDATFTRLDGTAVTTSMMSTTESLAYAKGDGYEAIALPYEGGDLSMLVVVPEAGKFSTFDAALTGRQLLDIAGAAAPKLVGLGYPKHHLEGDFDLVEPLKSLGMKTAFESGADFRNILPEDLFIRFVVQKTFVDVDEAGTEAAAATAVGIGRKSSNIPPEPEVKLTIDRPFLEAIIDRETKTVVFLGRILDPASK